MYFFHLNEALSEKKKNLMSIQKKTKSSKYVVAVFFSVLNLDLCLSLLRSGLLEDEK